MNPEQAIKISAEDIKPDWLDDKIEKKLKKENKQKESEII